MVTPLPTVPTAIPYPLARVTGSAPQSARPMAHLETRDSGDDAMSSQVEAMPVVGAFDVLFDATRLLTAGTRGADGDKTSPSQMFEPNKGSMTDAGERRRAGMKEEYRSGRANPSGDERFDRTSVDARRALHTGRSGDTGQQAAAQRSEFSAAHGGGAESASRSAGPGESLAIEGSSSGRVRAELSSANARAASSAITPPGAGGHALSPAPAITPPAAGLAVATVAPSGGTNQSQTQTPAQQVAQLLGAGRAGEVESGRAPTLPAATTNGRQGAADPKTMGRTSSGARSEENSSARQSAGTDAKTSEASRSTFDELVRSIRLQTGARRSSARLQLDPPELGRVYVNIRVEGEQLRIDVRTETAAARELLSGRAEQLVTALEQHGIQVERFEVTSGTSDEHPYAWRDHEGMDSEAAADRERDPRNEGAPSGSKVLSSEDIGASGVDDDAPDIGAVAETRLDIRV